MRSVGMRAAGMHALTKPMLASQWRLLMARDSPSSCEAAWMIFVMAT